MEVRARNNQNTNKIQKNIQYIQYKKTAVHGTSHSTERNAD